MSHAVQSSEVRSGTGSRPVRSCISLARIHGFSAKNERKQKEKQVKQILKKAENERTEDEIQTLEDLIEIVQELQKRARRREKVKAQQQETEDSPDVLDDKVKKLALLLRESSHAVFYTGAGVSTAAAIPDYRGPNGVWTLLQQGKQVESTSIVDACPTLTHMGIYKLHQEGLVKHVVSQNCDGLHLRSGLPQNSLSEIHGNMFIEVCRNCTPEEQYIRTFDVTENTSLHRHQTSRKCHRCRKPLTDTIVHFGEKSSVKFPLNWEGAKLNAEAADLIVCMGSSLKVLRRYSCLWRMNQPLQRRPKLCVINLQWTPKDGQAVLKISGRCDDVMQRLASQLNLQIQEYSKPKDPLFNLATPLRKKETESFSTKQLSVGTSLEECLLHTEDEKKHDQERKQTDLEGDETQSGPLQPGWFGKGLRRRSQSNKRRRRLSKIKDEL